MSKFLLRTVVIEDRTTETDFITGLKHEEVTVQLELIGSGDTRAFTNGQLVDALYSLIKEIEEEKATTA